MEIKNSLKSEVLNNCTPVGKLRYEHSTLGWLWVDGHNIPKEKGVYFLISPTGIEKVGSARGSSGLRGRLKRYCSNYSNFRIKDHTLFLWEKVMTGEMQGMEIGVYCMVLGSIDHRFSTPLGEIEVNMSPALEIESHFFHRAVNEGEPMRLCGANP